MNRLGILSVILGTVLALAVVSPAQAAVITLNDSATAAFGSGGNSQGWGDTYSPGAPGAYQPDWQPASYFALLNLVKFNLPTDLAGATINSVILHITIDDSHYGAQVRVWGDPGSWSAGSYNLTASDLNVVGQTDSYPDNGGNVSADVSYLVQQWADGALSSGQNGFAFSTVTVDAAAAAMRDTMYGFKSTAASWNPTQVTLALNYDPAPEPATMSLLVIGGIGALLKRRRTA